MNNIIRIQNCYATDQNNSKQVDIITRVDEQLYGHRFLGVREESSLNRFKVISFKSFVFESNAQERL